MWQVLAPFSFRITTIRSRVLESHRVQSFAIGDAESPGRFLAQSNTCVGCLNMRWAIARNPVQQSQPRTVRMNCALWARDARKRADGGRLTRRLHPRTHRVTVVELPSIASAAGAAEPISKG
jgi:hypothetical protein